MREIRCGDTIIDLDSLSPEELKNLAATAFDLLKVTNDQIKKMESYQEETLENLSTIKNSLDSRKKTL